MPRVAGPRATGVDPVNAGRRSASRTGAALCEAAGDAGDGAGRTPAPGARDDHRVPVQRAARLRQRRLERRDLRRARTAGTGPVEVTLRRPPPLDTPLTLTDGEVHDPDGHAGRRGTPGRPPATPSVPPVDPATARAAAAGYPGLVDHPFPGCYVCGPDRPDGLRIFPGRLPDGRTAAPFRAPQQVDRADGLGGAGLPRRLGGDRSPAGRTCWAGSPRARRAARAGRRVRGHRRRWSPRGPQGAWCTPACTAGRRAARPGPGHLGGAAARVSSLRTTVPAGTEYDLPIGLIAYLDRLARLVSGAFRNGAAACGARRAAAREENDVRRAAKPQHRPDRRVRPDQAVQERTGGRQPVLHRRSRAG